MSFKQKIVINAHPAVIKISESIYGEEMPLEK
jgi:hypothetical protein